jgi:nucleoid-associated protein YgaU
MRKDVKFGLTIGAILVVTLVIYVIVLSRGGGTPSQKIGIVMPGGSQQPSAQNSDSPGANDTDLNDKQSDNAETDETPSTGNTNTGTGSTGTAMAPANSAGPAGSAGQSGSNPSASASLNPPASGSTPDLQPAPATQPTLNANATPTIDWDSALNKGTASLPVPQRTETPSIDAGVSNLNHTGIARNTAPPMIDSYPSTQPSRPLLADVPALDAPASDLGATSPMPPTSARPQIAPEQSGTPDASRSESSRDLASATDRDSTSTPRTHRVTSGESLYSISQEVYGSGKYYKKILAANPGLDSRHLRIGQVLNLPVLGDADKPAAPAAGSQRAAVDPTKAYTVSSGDTLESISRKLYGTPGYLEQIYELNRGLIGPDENVLKIGWVLKLPRPPQTASGQ